MIGAWISAKQRNRNRLRSVSIRAAFTVFPTATEKSAGVVRKRTRTVDNLRYELNYIWKGTSLDSFKPATMDVRPSDIPAEKLVLFVVKGI